MSGAAPPWSDERSAPDEPPAPGAGAGAGPPAAPGWPPTPRSRPTNGLAVASLVIAVLAPGLALVPFVGLVPALIGLVLGILAVRRAKVIDSGQEVAMVGAVLSGLSLLLAIAAVVVVLVVGSALAAFVDTLRSSTGGVAPGEMFDLELPTPPSGLATELGTEPDLGLGTATPPADAAVGECFDDGSGTVPCDQPHLGEVFALLPVAESAGCSGTPFEEYVGTSYGSSRYFTGDAVPTTLEDGGEGVMCSLYVPDEQLTGSVRGRGD